MTRLYVVLAFTALSPLGAQESAVGEQPAPAPELAAPPAYVPLTAEQRWDDYVRRSFAPKALGARAAQNGVTNLWSRNPPEWDGVGGYGQRVASDFARTWMRRGMESAGAAALGHDPRYVRCPCDNAWKRIGHAFTQSFMTYDNRGEQVVGYARIGSRYGASMFESTVLFPDRYGWKDGLREGTQGFVSAGLFNIAREFWPDIKRKLRKRKN